MSFVTSPFMYLFTVDAWQLPKTGMNIKKDCTGSPAQTSICYFEEALGPALKFKAAPSEIPQFTGM